MKCVHCGAESTQGAKYCSQCGRIMASPAPSPATPPQPVTSPPVIPTAVQNQAPAMPQAATATPIPTASPMGIVVPPQKKSSLKKWLLIVAGVILLPLLLVFLAGVGASIFEAAATKGEAAPEVNNMPLDVPADYYRSPNGNFIVKFPTTSLESITVHPREIGSARSTGYNLDLGMTSFFVSENELGEPIDPLKQRMYLEAVVGQFAQSGGGEVVASEFKADTYATLDFAVRGENEDVVGRVLSIDPYTTYMLGYVLAPQATPDYDAYNTFLESFTYLGQIRN